MKGILIIALFFIVLSSYFIYLSIKEWKYIIKFEKNSIKTYAKVINTYIINNFGDETSTHMMKIKFTDYNNVEIIKDLKCDIYYRKVGNIIPIYYSKYDSNESMTDITNYPIFFIIFSSLFFIAGLIIFYINF